MWYTVWYCVPGQSMMYSERGWMRIQSLSEAKDIIEEGIPADHWWVSERPDGWLEARDQDFRLVYSTKKLLQQLKMF